MKIKDRVTNCTKMISKQNFVSYNQGVWNREGKEKSSWNDDSSKKTLGCIYEYSLLKVGMHVTDNFFKISLFLIDHFWLQQNDKKIYSLIISKT